MNTLSKKNLSSKDWRLREYERKKIIKRNRSEALRVFISLLKHSDPCVRMNAAAGLRQLRDQKAIKPLIKSINDPKNKNYRGTMIYALQTRNCKNLFPQIFQWALFGNYEMQNHALSILEKQSFKVSSKEMEKALNLISKYPKRKNKCDRYKLLLRELNKHLERIKTV